MPDGLLAKPGPEHLAGYAAALARAWSPNNIRGAAAAAEQLEVIAKDPAAFLATLDDPHGELPPYRMLDGTTQPRIPSLARIIWDGEFCGSITLRWVPGSSALPTYLLGHTGYAVVPWKEGRGYATRALGELLPLAWERGLDWLEVVVAPDNLASQKVVTNNGGVLIERFAIPPGYHDGEALRFRIHR